MNARCSSGHSRGSRVALRSTPGPAARWGTACRGDTLPSCPQSRSGVRLGRHVLVRRTPPAWAPSNCPRVEPRLVQCSEVCQVVKGPHEQPTGGYGVLARLRRSTQAVLTNSLRCQSGLGMEPCQAGDRTDRRQRALRIEGAVVASPASVPGVGGSLVALAFPFRMLVVLVLPRHQYGAELPLPCQCGTLLPPPPPVCGPLCLRTGAAPLPAPPPLGLPCGPAGLALLSASACRSTYLLLPHQFRRIRYLPSSLSRGLQSRCHKEGQSGFHHQLCSRGGPTELGAVGLLAWRCRAIWRNAALQAKRCA